MPYILILQNYSILNNKLSRPLQIQTRKFKWGVYYGETILSDRASKEKEGTGTIWI